ncbi:MAG: ThuA domain-containing protein [Phycisphaerae bacterium]|nr:ThuA domain-containing protein [Phycisphaerae bacterium]
MASDTNDITVAVITGGHAYDVVNFHRLFRALAGVDAYIQPLDDFAASPQPVRDAYDAVVLYFMPSRTPRAADELAWWQGDHRAALEHLGRPDQGLVVLHHAVLAYNDWPLWDEVVGIEHRRSEPFAYEHDQRLRVHVADGEHPITRGLDDWEMVDETYVMPDAGAGSRVLLTCDQSHSIRTLGWTRSWRQARVFCTPCGHDNQTWVNASFRELLRRGIFWAAGRL